MKQILFLLAAVLLLGGCAEEKKTDVRWATFNVRYAIKRNHNIKDYGKLIPGHGGIMDRFDSMTVTAPMTYFLTLLLMGLR